MTTSVRSFRLAALCGAILLSTAAGTVHAQFASVRGFVADAETNEMLAGVNVAVRTSDGRLYGGVSDADGYFVVNRVPAGPITVHVSFVGYATIEDSFQITSGEVRQLRLSMQAHQEELDEVVVEADAAAGAAITTAGLQTMTPADIERIPTPGVTGDLVGYLQTIPGVGSIGDRGGQFFIRGGTSTQNEVLLDGIPLVQPFHIIGFYSAFPSEVLNRVQFYKGGFGAAYGGRLSSVIDVESRNGNKQRFSGGVALAPLLSAVRVEGPIIPGRLSTILSVRESFVEDIMARSIGEKLPYRLGDRFGKLHAFLSSSSSLSVTGIRTHDRGDIGVNEKTFLGDEVPSIRTDSTQIRWANEGIGAKYLLAPVSTPILLTVSGAYNRYDTSVGNEQDPEREAEVTGLRFDASVTHYRGDTQIRAGIFASRQELRYELGGAFQDYTSNEEDLDEAGGFIEADLAVSRSWSIEPGFRIQAYPGKDKTFFEPRLRTVWYPSGRNGRHKLSAAGGLYHQALVGLTDERDIGNVFTAWISPPADDAIPSSIHGIVGWETRVRSWMTVSAEGYFKKLEDLLVPVFSPFPSFTTELQDASGTVAGLDVRAEVSAYRYEDYEIYGYAGYGLSRVEYSTPTMDYSPPHDRRHQFNLLLRGRRGAVEVVLQWQYGSGLPYTLSNGFDVWIPLTGSNVDVTSESGQTRVLFDDPYGARLPAYHRLDLWIEKSFEADRFRGSLRAGVLNAYNRDNLFYFDLFTFRRIDQLPLIPSVGIKLEMD